MNQELLQYLSVSVLPIIVLGLGWLILRKEHIRNKKQRDQTNDKK